MQLPSTPVRLVASALVAAAAVLGGLGPAAPAGDASSAATRAKLILDQRAFRPELALSSEQRSRGLMNRPKAPADGMLFVFPRDTTSGFWMKNTLVPLAIVFFDRRGRQVARLTMTPCRRDPCPIYSADRRYRFALELRAGDRRPAKRLGPLEALQRLSRSAT